MSQPRQPPGRAVRVAKRVGTRAGVRFVIHRVLVALVPAGCPLGLPFIVIEAVIAAAWVYTLGFVGFLLAGVTLTMSSIIVHPWFFALALTSAVIIGYIVLVVYLHIRLVVWWYRRYTR